MKHIVYLIILPLFFYNENKASICISQTIPNNNESSISVLYNSSFRVSNQYDPTKYLHNKWFELYEENGNYFIDYAQYSISKGIDDCTGEKIKTISSKRNTLVYFNYPTTKGKVTPLQPENRNITYTSPSYVKDSLNTQIYIALNGYLKPDFKEHSSNNSNYEDIRIVYYIHKNDKKIGDQILLHYSRCEECSCNVLFIGDIDRDGSYDVILKHSETYEDESISVFLSSLQSETNPLGLLGTITNIFDC